MPEILPNHVPSPRTPLVWDGTAYRAVRGHTDGTVQVRGEDQVFSFKGVLAVRVIDDISGADGYVDSPVVPDDEIWVVTTTNCTDVTSATTQHTHYNHHDGVLARFHDEVTAFAAGDVSQWGGHVYLDAGDTVRVYFTGGLAVDTCHVVINGYRMTLET